MDRQTAVHTEPAAPGILIGENIMTLYIIDNETGETVDAIEGGTNSECESIAEEKWGSNDYTWSYTA